MCGKTVTAEQSCRTASGKGRKAKMPPTFMWECCYMVVHPWNLLTCIVIVGVVSPPAAVSVVCAADTVMAVGLMTWLERVAMVPKVVIGVAREALVLWAPAPARLVETVPVTVPRVVTPNRRKR